MILAPGHTNEQERLADLISLNLSDINKKEQFDTVVLMLSKSLNVPIAYVSSVEAKRQLIHASCGLDFESSDRSTSFCGHTILQDEIFIVEDTLEDERFWDNPLVVEDPKIRFYAGYPLKSLLGNNVGALCIADTKPRRLSEDELFLFTRIGDFMLERLRMFKLGELQVQIRESHKELEYINNQLYESNQFYERIFGQYMSNSLLQSIREDKKKTELGGEKRFGTVLISDLRKFSRIAEQYEAEAIIGLLNLYFGEMISIIHKYDGFINEIMGDGILVVFGAPNDVGNCALKAVQCAQEMQHRMIHVNQILEKRNLPRLEMGIGINTGDLIAGNIGSKERMKYGVVGDTVNTASRIESLTIGKQILISESTFKLLEERVKPVGKIRTKLKGYLNPITIYDVSD